MKGLFIFLFFPQITRSKIFLQLENSSNLKDIIPFAGEQMLEVKYPRCCKPVSVFPSQNNLDKVRSWALISVLWNIWERRNTNALCDET